MRKAKDAEFAKALSLFAGVVVLLLAAARYLWPLPRFVYVGIGEGCTAFSRLCHPFVHAGVLHALLNVYVLWQLVFFFPLRLRHILLAYAVACVCPWQLAVWPFHAGCVLGMSGVVYGLMGWVMPNVASRLRFNVVVAAWMAVGIVVQKVAVGMHLWCYVVCAVISFMRLRLRR